MAELKITIKEFLLKTLWGTTLFESLVAMVIVLLSFGLALMIYVNVSGSDNKQQQLNAHLLLNKIAIETVKEKAFYDEDIKEGPITIQKTILFL